MPIEYTRKLTGRVRSTTGNRHLGLSLAFVAGATNAGGFLAVQQYTSHMTGIVSSMADNLALGQFELVLGAIGALLSFLNGAACSAALINFSRRRNLHSQYALPLMLEAVLLLWFGLLGAWLQSIPGIFVSFTVGLLCYIMGLQNAIITKLSRAEIRTTHITGLMTDIGIDLGKLFYVNISKIPGEPPVLANRERLKNNALLLGCFFAGGVFGAVGFKHIGFKTTVPLALLLVALAIVPIFDDISKAVRVRQRG